MTTSFWHTDAVGGRPHHHRVIYPLHTAGVPNDGSSPNGSLWLWVPAFAGTTSNSGRAEEQLHTLSVVLAFARTTSGFTPPSAPSTPRRPSPSASTPSHRTGP